MPDAKAWATLVLREVKGSMTSIAVKHLLIRVRLRAITFVEVVLIAAAVSTPLTPQLCRECKGTASLQNPPIDYALGRLMFESF